MSIREQNPHLATLDICSVVVRENRVGGAMAIADGLQIAIAFKRAQLGRLCEGSTEYVAKKTSIEILETELDGITAQIHQFTR